MVDIFRALAEENRLRILALLSQNEMCVCEIEECLGLMQSNLSRHLTALKQCGILESYKQAQWTYYKISDKFKEEHHELWGYLVHKFAETPSYQTDLEECQKWKLQNICNSRVPSKSSNPK